jgi:hypothetical protein
MKFSTPVPGIVGKYVGILARLGASAYSDAQNEEKLYLRFAKTEAETAQILARRDGHVARWRNLQQQIADTLAPYR